MASKGHCEGSICNSTDYCLDLQTTSTSSQQVKTRGPPRSRGKLVLGWLGKMRQRIAQPAQGRKADRDAQASVKALVEEPKDENSVSLKHRVWARKLRQVLFFLDQSFKQNAVSHWATKLECMKSGIQRLKYWDLQSKLWRSVEGMRAGLRSRNDCIRRRAVALGVVGRVTSAARVARALQEIAHNQRRWLHKMAAVFMVGDLEPRIWMQRLVSTMRAKKQGEEEEERAMMLGFVTMQREHALRTALMKGTSALNGITATSALRTMGANYVEVKARRQRNALVVLRDALSSTAIQWRATTDTLLALRAGFECDRQRDLAMAEVQEILARERQAQRVHLLAMSDAEILDAHPEFAAENVTLPTTPPSTSPPTPPSTPPPTSPPTPLTLASLENGLAHRLRHMFCLMMDFRVVAFRYVMLILYTATVGQALRDMLNTYRIAAALLQLIDAAETGRRYKTARATIRDMSINWTQHVTLRFVISKALQLCSVCGKIRLVSTRRQTMLRMHRILWMRFKIHKRQVCILRVLINQVVLQRIRPVVQMWRRRHTTQVFGVQALRTVVVTAAAASIVKAFKKMVVNYFRSVEEDEQTAKRMEDLLKRHQREKAEAEELGSWATTLMRIQLHTKTAEVAKMEHCTIAKEQLRDIARRRQYSRDVFNQLDEACLSVHQAGENKKAAKRNLEALKSLTPQEAKRASTAAFSFLSKTFPDSSGGHVGMPSRTSPERETLHRSGSQDERHTPRSEQRVRASVDMFQRIRQAQEQLKRETTVERIRSPRNPAEASVNCGQSPGSMELSPHAQRTPTQLYQSQTYLNH